MRFSGLLFVISNLAALTAAAALPENSSPGKCQDPPKRLEW